MFWTVWSGMMRIISGTARQVNNSIYYTTQQNIRFCALFPRLVIQAIAWNQAFGKKKSWGFWRISHNKCSKIISCNAWYMALYGFVICVHTPFYMKFSLEHCFKTSRYYIVTEQYQCQVEPETCKVQAFSGFQKLCSGFGQFLILISGFFLCISQHPCNFLIFNMWIVMLFKIFYILFSFFQSK